MYDDWFCSNNRKAHQRKLNRLVRKINKYIENDDLWQGRFFIRQYSAWFYQYEDGSGGTLYVWLRFYDKKDNKYQEYYGDTSALCHFGGSRLWLTMNSFITEISSTWKEDPYKAKKDYTHINSDDIVKTATPYDNYTLQARF